MSSVILDIIEKGEHEEKDSLVINKLIVVVFLFSMSLYAQNTAPGAVSAPWKSLQFLIGTWGAKTTEGSTGATSQGTYTFQLELRDHILARHSSKDSCKGPADFDCEHSDLLYVYQDGDGLPFKAIYFDNEGHVIHYDVTTAENSVVFLSDVSQPGPQFRLVYELKNSVMYGKFQMRMPGQTEFKSYLEWGGAKK